MAEPDQEGSAPPDDTGAGPAPGDLPFEDSAPVADERPVGADRPAFAPRPRPRPAFDRPGPRGDRRGFGPPGARPAFGGGRPAPRPSLAGDPSLQLAEDEELVAGRRPVEEAFVARREAKRLLVVPQRRQALEKLVLHATSLRIPVIEVEGGTLTAVAGFDGHQGIALVVSPRRWASPDEILALAAERREPALVLVLDSLEDPQNVGTLLRSAEATGVHGAVFPTHRQAPLTPAAVKASAGAVEHLRLAPVDDLPGALADLHARGIRVVGADGDAPLTAREADLRGPIAIVVGSEGRGLGPAVRRRCDLLVRIPMHGRVESLNAAVAGSILLYEAAAQRRLPEAERPPRPADGAEEAEEAQEAEQASAPDDRVPGAEPAPLASTAEAPGDADLAAPLIMPDPVHSAAAAPESTAAPAKPRRSKAVAAAGSDAASAAESEPEAASVPPGATEAAPEPTEETPRSRRPRRTAAAPAAAAEPASAAAPQPAPAEPATSGPEPAQTKAPRRPRRTAAAPEPAPTTAPEPDPAPPRRTAAATTATPSDPADDADALLPGGPPVDLAPTPPDAPDPAGEV